MTLSGATPHDADEACEGLIAALEALNDEHTLGRYELLTPIGRGGMAVVWAARLRGTHGFSKIVAIKTILPVLSSDPRFERMFLAEAGMVSRIKHPNVCEVLDLGEERGVLYLVMEWIDGESLSALARGSGSRPRFEVPYGVAAHLMAQAARGLHAAHELRAEGGEPSGIVHRDVSPQNILVTCEGAVKIVDFGVAKAAQRSDQATDTGLIKGKVAYLAPEQIDKTALDARADVFALGVVLYEITTGVSPLRGETDLATLLNIASPDPVARPNVADYPPALWKIVARCLEKDRDARYPSMRELAVDLEGFAATAGVGIDEVAEELTAHFGERRSERARELRRAVTVAEERAARPERAQKKAPPTTPRRNLVAIAALLAIALIGFGLRVVNQEKGHAVAEAAPKPFAPVAPSGTTATIVAEATSAVTATVASAAPSVTAPAAPGVSLDVGAPRASSGARPKASPASSASSASSPSTAPSARVAAPAASSAAAPFSERW